MAALSYGGIRTASDGVCQGPGAVGRGALRRWASGSSSGSLYVPWRGYSSMGTESLRKLYKKDISDVVMCMAISCLGFYHFDFYRFLEIIKIALKHHHLRRTTGTIKGSAIWSFQVLERGGSLPLPLPLPSQVPRWWGLRGWSAPPPPQRSYTLSVFFVGVVLFWGRARFTT